MGKIKMRLGIIYSILLKGAQVGPFFSCVAAAGFWAPQRQQSDNGAAAAARRRPPRSRSSGRINFSLAQEFARFCQINGIVHIRQRDGRERGITLGRIVVGKSEALQGTVRISGAKNAALAIIPATILAGGESVLENMPPISDVRVYRDILEELGIRVNYEPEAGKMTINTAALRSCRTSSAKVRQLRASSLLLGPLLARGGEAQIAMPGGCDLGPRPIDYHLKGLLALGAEISVEHGCIQAKAPELKGAEIYLDYPSVGATENIMMAAALAKGTTTLENVAREPEIVDLASFLNVMGGKVKGAGTDTIKITGVSGLNGADHAIIPDRIEAGTFIAAAAATGGHVALTNIIPKHLDPVCAKIREMGVDISLSEDSLTVHGRNRLKPVDLKTMPYPGFPTDMQAQMMAAVCKAQGTSVITETVFEGRYKHVDELKRLGASIKVEGRSAVVTGVERLSGAAVNATDLRAGAALLIAGFTAEGETEISGAEHIDRGYAGIEAKFTSLGARIRRI
jgi:UDP-N-acetylglucosamine 1-carboxyvinyltransferase